MGIYISNKRCPVQSQRIKKINVADLKGKRHVKNILFIKIYRR